MSKPKVFASAKPMSKDKKLLTQSLLLSLGVGIFSTMFASISPSEYAAYHKPLWAPHFGILILLWAVMYVLMGVATYYIILAPESKPRLSALRLYGVQLICNFVWPLVFYSFVQLWFAFVLYAFISVLVLILTIQYFKIAHKAGYYLMPYLAWMVFVTVLHLLIACWN